MSAMTPVRGGANNGGADKRELFLKLFGGEVLTAFREHNILRERTILRTISQGKSASFPATWKTSAEYHTPGALITGMDASTSERVLTVDDLLISHVSFPEIETAMSHFDYRSEYSFQCGEALARVYDQNLFRIGVLTAKASATITGKSPGGTTISAANMRTDAAVLLAAFRTAAQKWDENNVPKDERYAYLLPEQYYMLLGSGSNIIHADYNREDNGSLASGKVFRAYGIKIEMTNNLAVTDTSADATINSKYRVDAHKVAVLFMQRKAVGTVQLLGMNIETAWLIQNQCWLTVAKMAIGHGALRPECAIVGEDSSIA